MSLHLHCPQSPLRQFIEWMWYYVDFYPDHDREHVLPDGTFELVINLQDTPRKLFDRHNPARYDAFERGWVSGAHTRYIVIDALPSSSMIGVHFKPGGAARFMRVPAGELRDRVVELDALWGSRIWEWRDRLLSARGAHAKFALLERLLLRQLAESETNRAAHPAVNWALTKFIKDPHVEKIAEVSRQLGISHKHFIHEFRREVGLTPKKFCRIRRFQKVLGQVQSTKAVDWPDLAVGGGYFDQAHFIHDFVGFSGMNPSTYLTQRLEGDPKFARASQ